MAVSTNHNRLLSTSPYIFVDSSINTIISTNTMPIGLAVAATNTTSTFMAMPQMHTGITGISCSSTMVTGMAGGAIVANSMALSRMSTGMPPPPLTNPMVMGVLPSMMGTASVSSIGYPFSEGSENTFGSYVSSGTMSINRPLMNPGFDSNFSASHHNNGSSANVTGITSGGSQTNCNSLMNSSSNSNYLMANMATTASTVSSGGGINCVNNIDILGGSASTLNHSMNLGKLNPPDTRAKQQVIYRSYFERDDEGDEFR